MLTINELLAEVKGLKGARNWPIEIATSPFSKHEVLSIYYDEEEKKLFIDITDENGKENK